MAITHALIIPTENLSAEDIAAIREFAEARAAGHTSPETPVLGWTVVSARDLVLRMARDGRSKVRLEVLIRAVQNGGRIDRDAVYEIAGYDPARSLKGFTRPLRRHVAAMQRDGVLPEDAVLPLVPIYDQNVASYQQAVGFEVPAPLVEVFAQVPA